jgi:hypothetical protein
MAVIRPSVLLLALGMSAPATYQYVTDESDITTALTRFVIAVPVAAIMLAFLRMITANYGEKTVEKPGDLRGSQPPQAVQPEPLEPASTE